MKAWIHDVPDKALNFMFVINAYTKKLLVDNQLMS